MLLVFFCISNVIVLLKVHTIHLTFSLLPLQRCGMREDKVQNAGGRYALNGEKCVVFPIYISWVRRGVGRRAVRVCGRVIAGGEKNV